MTPPDNQQTTGSGDVSLTPASPTETAPPDILDWEACIETPPPRPSGTIKVSRHFRGRDKPIPIDEPDDEKTKKSP